jgi:hypothetical protein
MGHAIIRRPLTAKFDLTPVPCRICGGQSVTGTVFSPSAWVSPCQYHSTIPTYLFIHLCIHSFIIPAA